MQFIATRPLADFPHDPVPSSTDALKDARDLICHTAAGMSLGGYASTRKELSGVTRSASGHSLFGRVGEYAAVRFGSEMRGVTIVVRPSQVEIVAVERKQIVTDRQAVRGAKAYARVTREALEHDLHLRVEVVREAVRLFDSMEAIP